MTLTKEQYAAFEAIVGPDSISDDPVDLDAWAWASGQFRLSQDFTPRFEAILLPRSSEEVQAVLRLCNKLGVQFKASSTGWGTYCDPGGPGCIKLDMRRMNRIIEIDEESMFAVVEPYVVHAQLQSELMRRGLTCNVNGAGAQTSAMPLVAHEGIGHMSATFGFGERNLLAWEWITPEGEIVRSGSLGSLGEWFCGDGPGPSLRGVIRGNVVPLGGLGVFTKAAVKIYHWAGPPTTALKGRSPFYAPAEPPENFLLRFYSWPTEEGRAAFFRKLGESEIAFGAMGFNAHMIAGNCGTGNEHELELLAQFKSEAVGPGVCVVIAGTSARDFDYKKQVLELMSSELHGVRMASIEEGDLQNAFIWRFTRVTGSIRECLRATGVMAGEVFGTGNYASEAAFIQHSRANKAELVERGLVYDDGLDPLITSLEQGQLGHSECLLRLVPDSTDAGPALLEFVDKANAHARDGHFGGLPHHTFGDRSHDFFGPFTSNYTKWLRAIKVAFDPNEVSESSNHISAEA